MPVGWDFEQPPVFLFGFSEVKFAGLWWLPRVSGGGAILPLACGFLNVSGEVAEGLSNPQ